VRALAEDYLSTLPSPQSITWICNHSRNTQLALLHNHIDLALTYERSQEALAAAEGWSKTAGCVFHCHFVIAGPISDPAGLRFANSPVDAIRRIAAARALFHSRADASATMWKERGLWEQAGCKPWEEASAETWYKTSLSSPADALKNADTAGAYLLTDRSTLLRQTGLENISKTTVFFEPSEPNDVLMNSCYALYRVDAASETVNAIKQFLEHVWSDRGQRVIGSFGADQVGAPLFATVNEGFARSRLSGRRPLGGKSLL
jgi:tungstate transport system substrate-binding protein